jgi:dienelactone hydrolase
MPMTTLLGGALGLLLAVLALRALLHAAIRAGLAAPRVAHDRTPADMGLAATHVRIPTAHGLLLHGWLIGATDDESSNAPNREPGGEPKREPAAAPDGRALHPAAIVLHGWGGNAAMMLPLAPALHTAGYAVLLIDARCHGASDADDFASLPRFAEDVEHAFDWLARQPGIDARRIALLGHSVGAGAVLLAASRKPDVGAVVSVAAFSHPATMMRRWLAAKHIPLRPLGNYILRYVERTIGHRFDDIAPERTIARVRCPVLLVHGADDMVVPVDDAKAILAARAHGRVELLLLPGDHENFGDASRDMKQLVDFLARAADNPRADRTTAVQA